MTQELSVWVLLAGLLGLMWILTYAILSDDQAAAAESGDEKEPPEHNDQQRTGTEPGRIAA